MTAPAAVGTGVVARTGTDRATLVRRTYGLVLGGVIVTMAGVVFGMSQPPVMEMVAAHPFIGFLVCLMLPMFLAQRMHRQFPQNVAMTLLGTFATGVYLSPLIFIYNRIQPGAVGQAGMLTLSTFIVLSAYAAFSRRDFSAWGGFFVVGLWVLIATSILNIFFRNETASLWIAGATVFVFGGLLVFDTSRLLRSEQYGPDDYVPAAIAIYLDLLNLFLAILRLVGGRRN
jgi:FtsH-binding integral membrane protein